MKTFIRRSLSCIATATLLLATLSAYAGFSVSGTQLLDAHGNPFVMRGVNLPHAWYTEETSQALAHISNRGANTVRVVLANGVLWSRTPASQIQDIISQAKDQNLIVVLEVHDTTGYGEQHAATLDQAVDYWISISDALMGEEAYVIINIGNEPHGNGHAASTWVNDWSTAIQRMRNAGFTHTLMVDAANWGQDWEQIMLNNAQTVFNSDPLDNTIFSVHMYEVYPNDNAVNSYMSAFHSMGLHLLVGEFAADHFGSYVDAGAILARAEQYGFGYLGWSWSGNGSGLESLDIVTNFSNNLSPWGELLFNSSNGITNTSQLATVYTDGDTGGSDGGGSNSGGTGEQCNWHGDFFPICEHSDNGWGWENNQSCIGHSDCAAAGGTDDSSDNGSPGDGDDSPGAGGCGIANNGYPYCCDSSSDTGGGWGWENNQSCVMQSGSGSGGGATSCNWYGNIFPLCNNQSSGWGWENDQSCIGADTCNSQ